MSTDLGWKAVLGLQMLSRAMGHHGHGNCQCHLCSSHSDKRLQIPLPDHILDAHWEELHLHSEIDTDRILEMLGGYNLEVLPKFKKT